MANKAGKEPYPAVMSKDTATADEGDSASGHNMPVPRMPPSQGRTFLALGDGRVDLPAGLALLPNSNKDNDYKVCFIL